MRGAVLGLVVAACAMGAPGAGAVAADMSHLRDMAGLYTHEVLADPALDQELRSTLGTDYAKLEEVTTVVFPTELVDNRYLAATGCMQHDCGFHRGLVLVDLDTGSVLVLRSDDDETEALAGGDTELTPAAEGYVSAWQQQQ